MVTHTKPIQYILGHNVFLFMNGLSYKYVHFPNHTAPTRPINLTVFSIICNQLNLTWMEPMNTGGLPIINYQVKYSGGVGETTTATTTEPMITLEKLLPETTYEMKVEANNSILSDTNTKIMKTTLKRRQGKF